MRPTLLGNLKFRRLVKRLGIHRATVIGFLEILWGSCYENGDDGVGTSDDIEGLVGWEGIPGSLTLALLEAGQPIGEGFLEIAQLNGDPAKITYRVHHLWHHVPDYVRKRHVRELGRRAKTAPTLSLTHDSTRRTYQDGQNDSSQDRSLDEHLNQIDQRADSSTPSSPVKATPADLRKVWNAITTSPIKRCSGLSRQRLGRAAKRLKERPFSEWQAVIARIQASAFCRGGGNRKWVADFDWLLDSETAVKVLEGKYDDAAVETATANTVPALSALYDKSGINHYNIVAWLGSVKHEITSENILRLWFAEDDARSYVTRNYGKGLAKAAKELGYLALEYHTGKVKK